MKRVIFLIHDLCQGGAEKVLVNLVNNMDKTKFDVTVFSLFDVGVNKQFISKDIRYRYLFKKVFRGNSHLFKLFSPKRLYKLLIKEEHDVVISYLEGPTARIVGGAPKGVKVVSWVHSTVKTTKELSASFRNKKEAERCYFRADQMVFVSRSVRDSFLNVCKTKNNVVLYNTSLSNDIICKSQDAVDEYRFHNARFDWCAVGKLVPLKGFDRMLRIHKRLIDSGMAAHFHILGVGSEHERMNKWCIENNISDSVTFWGYQTNPYKIVAKCDLFVCASHSEGFSTAATEALIVGTPVCTVEVGGMKEMLGENNEWGIVTPNDEEELYKAIKNLLDNPDCLKHYTEMAKLRGKSFSTEATVKAVEGMLLNL